MGTREGVGACKAWPKCRGEGQRDTKLELTPASPSLRTWGLSLQATSLLQRGAPNSSATAVLWPHCRGSRSTEGERVLPWEALMNPFWHTARAASPPRMVTARPPWSICCTSEVQLQCQQHTGRSRPIPPPDPFLPTTHCGLSAGVTLRCSGFLCLLKSARDNQEYCTRTDSCHMLGIISKQ